VPIFEGAGHRLRVGDIRLDQLGALRQGAAHVLLPARGEIVEDHDTIAPSDEGVDEVPSKGRRRKPRAVPGWSDYLQEGAL
jgi:hypothetical protein